MKDNKKSLFSKKFNFIVSLLIGIACGGIYFLIFPNVTFGNLLITSGIVLIVYAITDIILTKYQKGKKL